MLLRIGSRGSRLALTQAELAASRLRRPGVEIALVPITTAGDRDRTRPFGEIGSRGVFVKELEEALLDGRVDVAVHSAKDMTSTDTSGLAVGAYLPREDPRDALCGASSLRAGMRVGTASIRIVCAIPDHKLRITVADSGAGFVPEREGDGIASIRDRLTALYGTNARLDLHTGEAGDTKAIMEIPRESADAIVAKIDHLAVLSV